MNKSCLKGKDWGLKPSELAGWYQALNQERQIVKKESADFVMWGMVPDVWLGKVGLVSLNRPNIY